MEILEKKAIDIIRNWRFSQDRIETLRMTLREQNYSLNNALSLAPASPKGPKQSKVETFAITLMNYKKRYEKLVRERDLYLKVFNTTDLNTLEKDLILAMAKGITPLNFSRINKLYPLESVYKVQYRAVKKLVNQYKQIKEYETC